MNLTAITEAWYEANRTNNFEVWTEHLDRLELSDHFAFLDEQKALLIQGILTPLHEWLNHLGGLKQSEPYTIINDTGRSALERLAVATFIRWRDRVRSLLIAYESLPSTGVLQYFSDGLRVCILVGYRRSGSTVVLEDVLAFPKPEAFFDPLFALAWAHTDQELELLRRALFSRHKVVIHRNVLTHIDREHEDQVFGPSIDTLVLNEWLFENRYCDQRSVQNIRYFEEVIPPDLADETANSGTRFLEIGCGNGLLTATFARNEARIRQICAIDVSMPSIVATFRNSWKQRRLPRGGMVGDRARYITGRYAADAVPISNDLVICNPPYVPRPAESDFAKSLHPLTRATVGTDLLESVARDAKSLLATKGQLVMIISEMATPELLAAVPDGFVAKKIQSRGVPFNVGAVRGETALLSWLVAERGLERSGNGYRHNVCIFLLERTSN